MKTINEFIFKVITDHLIIQRNYMYIQELHNSFHNNKQLMKDEFEMMLFLNFLKNINLEIVSENFYKFKIYCIIL